MNMPVETLADPIAAHAQAMRVPRERIIGLSKIPRIIDLYAHDVLARQEILSVIREQ